MFIDKIIKKEIITLLVSVLVLLLIFIGVSYASFLITDQGSSNVINVGDLEITYCADESCASGSAVYGQVIGTSTTGSTTSPSPVYPYATSTEALATAPYIFEVQNTGSLKNYLSAYIVEDTTFELGIEYSTYSSTTTNYSQYINVAINECSGGTISTTGVTIYNYSTLTNGKILDSIEISPSETKTYCVWTWLNESTPNGVQQTYFVADLNFEASYSPIIPTLLDVMLARDTAYSDSVSSPYVSASTGINFGAISSDTNG